MRRIDYATLDTPTPPPRSQFVSVWLPLWIIVFIHIVVISYWLAKRFKLFVD
jgi:hypothetical protein